MCVEFSSRCLWKKYRIPDIDIYFDILQRRFYFILDVCFTRLCEEKEMDTLFTKDKMTEEFNCVGSITFLRDPV